MASYVTIYTPQKTDINSSELFKLFHARSLASELSKGVDNLFMKIIRLPNPIVLVFGGLAAFSIADMIHPGFNPIGIMILLLIPVLIIELLYPTQELEEQLYPAKKPAEPIESVAGELIEESMEKAESL